MSETVLFACGVGLTLAITLGVIVYLMPHLRRLLTELCGTAERAAFWAAFSNVTVGLVPLILALSYEPERGVSTPRLARQLEQALGGLVASVLVLGIVLSMFVSRARGGREEA